MIRSRHYTTAHEAFRGRVREFLERECAPHRTDWQQAGRTPPDMWRKAGQLGILGATMSPAYGGGGGDLYHTLVVIEEQTRIGLNELTFYLHSDIVTPYIELYGTEEQKQRYLPGLASGERIAAIAMTEPGAGSDLQAIRTTALAEGNGYVLNGQKVFISNGQIANLICVAAKTDPSAGGKGISLFLMETDAVDGFVRGRNLNKIGCKAQDSSELFFDNVRLPHTALLGGVEGLGFAQMMQRLPEERLIMAMSAVTMMEEAVRETDRFLSGVNAPKTAETANARFTLAGCKTKTMLGRAFLDSAIIAFVEGKFDAAQGAMIKWWTTQRQYEVVDECHQLHGESGFLMESGIARRYTDSRLGRIAGGTNEIMKDLIGRSL